MKKKIIIIAIVAALLYLLYKRGTFDSLLNKDDGETIDLGNSNANINVSSLYKDHKADLELYVNRLDLNVTAGDSTLMRYLTVRTNYKTESSVKDQLKSWVKLIWLSAKNNDKWTQAGVQSQANSNGVTYNQQIVMDAIWQMCNSEIIPNYNYSGLRPEVVRGYIKNAFDNLITQVQNM